LKSICGKTEKSKNRKLREKNKEEGKKTAMG
jgi:hypothetical protein